MIIFYPEMTDQYAYYILKKLSKVPRHIDICAVWECERIIIYTLTDTWDSTLIKDPRNAADLSITDKMWAIEAYVCFGAIGTVVGGDQLLHSTQSTSTTDLWTQKKTTTFSHYSTLGMTTINEGAPSTIKDRNNVIERRMFRVTLYLNTPEAEKRISHWTWVTPFKRVTVFEKGVAPRNRFKKANNFNHQPCEKFERI
jgi:hypothetical protein